MRKQIAAANWKMNLEWDEAVTLIDHLIKDSAPAKENNLVILAVPHPYLTMAVSKTKTATGFKVAAQNCHSKPSGAYTGEVSAPMLRSIGISHCIIGHSERREYFHESHSELAAKTDICFENSLIPIFCCGETLPVREAGDHMKLVASQILESLFHLPAEKMKQLVIAYEPVWAIGTGKTASTEQAQEMHAHLRATIASQYGDDIAGEIPILYGGSVKPSNAGEIFASADVDGGLVGGASLSAADFHTIIQALK
jgi:triosephosphate isomerase